MIYGERIQAPSDFFNWIPKLDDESFDNFFTDYAGQARIRWHYGVAHSLLCNFEDSFMAESGRDWLTENNANQAKTLVSPPYFFPPLSGNELQELINDNNDPIYFRKQSCS